MADQDEDSLAKEQDEAYLKLRARGVDKLEAADKAAPPDTTEERANSEGA